MVNILDRRQSLGLPLTSSHLNSTQLEQDEVLKNFSHEASDWKSLTAMMAGGLAYRLGNIATLKIIPGNISFLSKLAPATGLFTEVATFRGVNKILSCRGEPMCSPGQTQGSAPTWKDWLTDYINFGTLKIFGKFGGQNIFLNHFVQDTGMVAGHHLAYGLGLATAPQGKILQQYLHAEATNIALAAGTSLAHQITNGKLLHYEKSLELHLDSSHVQNTVNNPFSLSESLFIFHSPPPDLNQDLVDELNGTQWKAPTEETNTPYPPSRVDQETSEIARLHSELMLAGGVLLVDPDMSPLKLMEHLAAGNPLLQLGSVTSFEDTLWGRVDLRALAQPNAYQYYRGNVRQAELFRDIAIAFGEARVSVTHARSEWGSNGNRIFRDNHWNNLPATWQRFLWMAHRLDWAAYQGPEGYDNFALAHFEGYSQAAWKFARCFFPNRAEMKKGLAWIRMKYTNVNQEGLLRNELLGGIERGHFLREEGYDLWAITHFSGYSQTAGYVARSLLTAEQFKLLKWPYLKVTNVKDQVAIRDDLRLGIREGNFKAETGYDLFTEKWFNGYPQRAWVAARSLLPEAEFKLLEWPEIKKLNLKEAKFFKRVLNEAIESETFVEESGYDDFADTYFLGDSARAWDVALEVLSPEQFILLKWPKRKVTQVRDQEKIRENLREGLRTGELFGEKGLNLFAQMLEVTPQRAWAIARCLVTNLEFLLLAWEEPKKEEGEVSGSERVSNGKALRLEGVVEDESMASIEDHILHRFLFLVRERPSSIGRRLLILVEEVYAKNPEVIAMARWLRRATRAELTPPASPEGEGKPDPTKEPSPSQPKEPMSEEERSIRKLLAELTKHPREKGQELLADLESRFGNRPSVLLIVEWFRASVEGIAARPAPLVLVSPTESDFPPPRSSDEGAGNTNHVLSGQLRLPFIETAREVIDKVNLNPQNVQLEDLTILQREIADRESYPIEALPCLNAILRLAFEATGEVRVRAGEIAFANGEAVLNAWNTLLGNEIVDWGSRVKSFRSNEMKITATRLQTQLGRALERNDTLCAARCIGQLMFLADLMKSSSLKRSLQKTILSRPNPLLRLAALAVYGPSGKVVCWDEYEKVPLFNDLLAGDPNCQRFARAILLTLKDDEVASGSKGRSIHEVAEALDDPQELKRLKMENCPEVSIERQGMREHLDVVFADVLRHIPAELGPIMINSLVERIMQRVATMNFFELRDLYFSQGGPNGTGSAPYRVIRDMLVEEVRARVASGEIDLKTHQSFFEILPDLFNFLNQDLIARRGVKQNLFPFPPAREFRSARRRP